MSATTSATLKRASPARSQGSSTTPNASKHARVPNIVESSESMSNKRNGTTYTAATSTKASKVQQVPDVPAVIETLQVDGEHVPLMNIRATGDLILDVTFINSTQCTRSIPKDSIRNLHSKKLVQLPSPRFLYRVRLETLKKHSKYFQALLKPQFSEGLAVEEALKRLEEANFNPTELEADMLPRVYITDEDTATKTTGRESVFRDLLLLIHGLEPLTSRCSTLYISVLAVIADKYNAIPSVDRHLKRILASHKFKITADKNGEEALRQRILIQLHVDKGSRFTQSTRELILKGSVRWTDHEQNGSEYETAWWDLPYGLEAELAERRSCVLRTIASIQNQFLKLYSSKDQQCRMGYGNSGACDSFQLGETVKFLVKKDMLSLVPFHVDERYIWPDAYQGEVDNLIMLLRQCPSYQIDGNHSHCGFRNKLLPALDFIKKGIEVELGVRLTDITKQGSPIYDSWVSETAPDTTKPPFVVGDANGRDIIVAGPPVKRFDFMKIKSYWNSSGNADGGTKTMFTADEWSWIVDPDVVKSDMLEPRQFRRPLPGGFRVV